jgi:ADP-ribosylglycohydrolase
MLEVRLATLIAIVLPSFLLLCHWLAAQSRTTHASPIAEECCRFAAGLIFMLLRGRDYATAKEDVLSLGWSDKLTDAIGKPLADVNDGLIPSGGYVLDSLRAALWCIENTNSFENAVLLAVNLGDDADTTAAVTGQIAGAMYGYSTIKNKMKSALFGERRLYVTSQFLARKTTDSRF